MLKTKCWMNAGMAIAGLAVIAAAPSSALAQANCEMYAKLALQQQRENVAKNCGFTGPDWNPDPKGHLSWCGSASPQQWQAALKRRKLALDKCG